MGARRILIGPTGYGTFAYLDDSEARLWPDRGRWGGPFKTAEEARERVQAIIQTRELGDVDVADYDGNLNDRADYWVARDDQRAAS